MREDSDFAAHVLDLLQPIGDVRSRAMFGGFGIYLGSAMFGLIAYGQLYFKVDDLAREAFRSAGSRPFVYHGKGRPYEMSYWLAPEGSLDDGAELERRARLGIDAALRAAGERRSRNSPRRSRPNPAGKRRIPPARRRKTA